MASRQSYRCPDAIFTIKSIQHLSSRLNKEIYILFVDLTAAYDWCVRKCLFQTIYNRIDPSDKPTQTCIRIIEELYKKTLSCMKGETNFFETTSGVRQGGPESPNLFNLYLDYIMRIYNDSAKKLDLGISFTYRIRDQAGERADKHRYRVIGYYPWLGYADDLAITAETDVKLQKAADLLNNLFYKFGLTISIDKTKSIILNHQSENYPETIITIDNKNISNVKDLDKIL